ncbi:MAG: cysteate synthase [Nitrospirae bacterium]|nr:MAG: cysteate synthase [Nitrospirota bacterium]
MSHFTIRCRKCGKELTEVYCAFCEHCMDALLVTVYKDAEFRDDRGEGIWKYRWLPVHTPSFAQPGTIVYRSRGLGSALGLGNLYIAFNGYWPEQGAWLQTCTFKEFEAAVVLQNALENGIDGLVVASAGNTARAFAHLSTVAGYPVVIVVPGVCLQEMWYLEESSAVPTVAVTDGDYSDSIDVARRIAGLFNFPFEGGVKNIAKRDGLGTTILAAVAETRRLPDHYFQAVGSGTGGIGVWEMSERLIRDGRFGKVLPRMHLAQNLPFAPMVRAWQKESRTLFPEDLRPELIAEITTRVLSTRYPAYSIQGGVYDVMKAAGGRMYGVVNDEVYAAMELFAATEGIDIVPAAGVATAALKQAVSGGFVKPEDLILLNITGGGEKRLGREKQVKDVVPMAISKKASDKELEELLCTVLKKN